MFKLHVVSNQSALNFDVNWYSVDEQAKYFIDGYTDTLSRDVLRAKVVADSDCLFHLLHIFDSAISINEICHRSSIELETYKRYYDTIQLTIGMKSS